METRVGDEMRNQLLKTLSEYDHKRLRRAEGGWRGLSMPAGDLVLESRLRASYKWS